MSAQRGRTADFDGAHRAQLPQRQFVRLPVPLAVLSKNAGQLESWPVHRYFFLPAGVFAAGRILAAGRSRRSSGLMVAATTWGDTRV
jgi:hypothetical protein